MADSIPLTKENIKKEIADLAEKKNLSEFFEIRGDEFIILDSNKDVEKALGFYQELWEKLVKNSGLKALINRTLDLREPNLEIIDFYNFLFDHTSLLQQSALFKNLILNLNEIIGFSWTVNRVFSNPDFQEYADKNPFEEFSFGADGVVTLNPTDPYTVTKFLDTSKEQALKEAETVAHLLNKIKNNDNAKHHLHVPYEICHLGKMLVKIVYDRLYDPQAKIPAEDAAIINKLDPYGFGLLYGEGGKISEDSIYFRFKDSIDQNYKYQNETIQTLDKIYSDLKNNLYYLSKYEIFPSDWNVDLGNNGELEFHNVMLKSTPKGDVYVISDYGRTSSPPQFNLAKIPKCAGVTENLNKVAQYLRLVRKNQK